MNENENTRELERLLAGYVDRLNAGERLDPAAIMDRHPELGEELLDELEIFLDLETATESEPLGVLGDYKLLRRLGRGGMGVVYEAHQIALDRRVAVKVLPAGLLADSRAVSRFLREAKAAGRLQHPNIVSVFGMEVQANTPYIVLEYVDGENLAQVLARLRGGVLETAKGPFDTREVNIIYCGKVAEAFAAVAEGLAHAHAKGVVHRDIKPSNLILDREGRVRILDFGLARLDAGETLTASGDFLGTPLYMSPEQARSPRTSLDHRTDIYSLGATLYEMLAWHPPFEGEHYQETLSHVLLRDPPPMRRSSPRIPADIETIVLKCLEKNSADRYQSADALAADLRRFVRGDPIEARPPGVVELVLRRAARHKRRLVLAFVLCGLSVALVASLVVARRQAHRERELEYRRRVLDAVLSMELGSLSQRAESGETLLIDPSRWIFARGELGELAAQDGANPVERAAAELEVAAKLMPERADAHYHRARALRRLGRDKEALDELQALVLATPSFAPAVVLAAAIERPQGGGDRPPPSDLEMASGEAWAAHWLEAHRSVERKDFAEAVGAYGRLIALVDDEREPYVGFALETRLGRAAALIAETDYAGALMDVAVAQHLVRESVELSLLEGQLRLQLKDEARASALFDRLHREAEHGDEVALAVHAIYALQRRMDEALGWINKLAPGYAREMNRSFVLYELGRVDEAVDAAEDALALNSRGSFAIKNLAFVLLHALERPGDARNILETAIEIEPADAGAWLYLGDVFLAEERFDEAEEHYRHALSIDAKQWLARANLGIALSRQGRAAESIQELETAREMEPRHPYIHFELGNALVLAGCYDQAEEKFDDAIRLDPLFAWPRTYRGELFERQGRLEGALADFDAASRLTPREARPLLGLGRVLETEGRLAEAFEAYVEAIVRSPANRTAHDRVRTLIHSCADLLPEAAVRRLLEACETSEGRWGKDAAIRETRAVARAALGE
jgi:tetratricopeptide (TPR) repeat protein